LFFVFLILVLLIIALLLRDWGINQPAFSLATSEFVDTSEKKGLELHGENFHSGMKGVLSKTLLNEDALLWHRFTDIPFRAIGIRGNLGLLSFKGNKVVSMSFDEEGKPSLLGSLDMPGNVSQIEIVGRKALVGMTKGAGLSIIDMNDPMDLKPVAHYPLPGPVFSMVAENGVAYFAGRHMGVYRLDYEAEKPVMEKLTPIDFPLRLAIQGERLAVGTVNGRVHLFDIDRAGAFVETDVLDFESQVRGVAFTKEALTIALDDRIIVFDLSTWPGLTQTGQLILPAQPFELKAGTGDERVVVAMVSAGLGLLDISRREAPILSGWFKVPKTYKDFLVYPEKILGTNNEGLDSISIKDIESGEMSKLAQEAIIDKGQYQLKEWSQYIYGYAKKGPVEVVARALMGRPSSDRYLPFVDGQDVTLYEQNESGQLESVGSVTLKEKVVQARLHGGHLYVSYRKGLRVFSVEHPDEMIAVADLPIPGTVHCFEPLASGVLMVSTHYQGLLVLDISEPKELKEVARLKFPSYMKDRIIRDILIDGERAYLSQGDSGLYVVDMSSPHQPEILQKLDTPGHASVMALHDDFLYIADRLKGLFAVDVKDQERALPIGSIPVPVRILSMAAADDGLIVSATKGGTLKLPLLQRLQDVRIVSDEEAFVDVVSAETGQYVYLYDDRVSTRVNLAVH